MNTYVYIVQYNGPKVFKKKKDAQEFYASKQNGIFNFCDEQHNGEKWVRTPIKVKVR